MNIESSTWMYSIGLSSPASRLVVYLVAGKAFGTVVKRTLFLEFVIVRFATETMLSHADG